MHIIGPDPLSAGENAVHTIDIWFSEARRHWVVQRFNGLGDPVGHDHFCRSQAEAKACLAYWLRRHPETHLLTPQGTGSKRRTRRAPRPGSAL